MAVRAEIFIKETLQGLAPDDPDRSFLEKQLREFEDFNRKQAPLRGSERLLLRDHFTPEERKALKEDGVEIYTLKGTTIPEQREARDKAGKPSFWHVVNAGDRLLAVPSRRIEVGIYPDPEKFFVPGTFGKDTDIQESLVTADGQALSKRLGLTSIAEIIPDEAATFTDLVFQHEKATGVWLFGPEFAKAVHKYLVYGRTKNSTNKNGSHVALVGYAFTVNGLDVDGWYRGRGHDDVGSPRLVVPIEHR